MVMTLLLAIALLMAMGFSSYYQRPQPRKVSGGENWITIGQHSFAIPSGWEAETRDIDWPLDTSHVVIRHSQAPFQRMIFSTLPDMGMCSPELAMQQATRLFFGKKKMQVLEEQSFRQRSFVGRVMMVRLDPQADMPATRHILAVYTQDGRYYQLIHHLGVVGELSKYSDELRELEDLGSLSLVLHMARVSANDRFRHADADARRHAMIAPLASQELNGELTADNRWRLGQVDQWQDETAALTILPNAGQEGFWRAHVLGGPGSPNVAQGENNAWPSTQAQLEVLLAQMAEDDENPQRYRITQMQSLAIRGWHVGLEDPQEAASRDGLVREYWYLPGQWLRENMTDGAAVAASLAMSDVLLVELLAAPDALEKARVSLVSAIKSLQLAPQIHADINQETSWQTMLDQGQSMAKALGSDLADKLRRGRDYSLFFVDLHPAGFALHDVRSSDGPLSLRGDMVLFQLTRPNVIHTESWATSSDGSRMWLTSTSLQRQAQGPPSVKDATRYLLADDGMSIRSLPTAVDASAAEEKVQWQVPTPPNLIPWVMADRVDPSLLASWADTPGGLVWRSINNQPPAACIMLVQRVTDHENPAIAWRLSMRLMASPREDVHLLDEQGWMLQSNWHIVHDSQGSPTMLSVVRTDRDTIVKAFDRWLPDIIAWETRQDSNDQEPTP